MSQAVGVPAIKVYPFLWMTQGIDADMGTKTENAGLIIP